MTAVNHRQKYQVYVQRDRFAENRERAIQRDGEKCIKCGMSRSEHRAKYKRDITVDHIDGRGRYTPKSERNNNLDNLQTLCLSCHGRKDVFRAKHARLTLERAINIRHARGSATAARLAELYGISRNTVWAIQNKTTWKVEEE